MHEALLYGDIALFCNKPAELFLEVLNQLNHSASSDSKRRIQRWFSGTTPNYQMKSLQSKLMGLSFETQKKDTSYFPTIGLLSEEAQTQAHVHADHFTGR